MNEGFIAKNGDKTSVRKQYPKILPKGAANLTGPLKTGQRD